LTLRDYAIFLDAELDACATLADVEATLALLSRPGIGWLLRALKARQIAKRWGGARAEVQAPERHSQLGSQ
jgi:hypothetical protein